MEITVEIENKEFTLPKKTLKLAKMIDSAYGAGTSEESYKKQYAFVREVLGADATKELLDGDKVEDIDLVLLSIAFVRIERAYTQPVGDERNREDDREVMEKMDKIVSVGNAIEKISKTGKR